MSINKTPFYLSAFLIIFFLSSRLSLLSQINDADSVTYFAHLRADSLLGLNIKGKILPRFIVKDKTGSLFSSEDLNSKITFINFWFETCAPCAAEFQALEKFYNRNRDRKNFQFISITYEADTVIERVQKQNVLTYPVYHLSIDSCRKVLVKLGYPTNLIINKAGKIVYSITGGPIDPKIADKFLNYFIQEELEKQMK